MKNHLNTPIYAATFFLTLICLVSEGCGLIDFYRISKSDLLSNSQVHWIKDSSASSDIYFEPGSWASSHILTIKADADSSLMRNLSLIGESQFEPRINYFIVNNRSRMHSLIGREPNATADANEHVICAIANDSVLALGAHEVSHVVVKYFWGETETWISEGMAVYADDEWWGYNLHQLANYLAQHKKLPSLEQLTNEFRRHNDLISYPASGSLMKFLYEKFGRSEIKLLWKQGFSAFCKSVGHIKSDLEREWLSVIAQFNTDNINYTIPE